MARAAHDVVDPADLAGERVGHRSVGRTPRYVDVRPIALAQRRQQRHQHRVHARPVPAATVEGEDEAQQVQRQRAAIAAAAILRRPVQLPFMPEEVARHARAALEGVQRTLQLDDAIAANAAEKSARVVAVGSILYLAVLTTKTYQEFVPQWMTTVVIDSY